MLKFTLVLSYISFILLISTVYKKFNSENKEVLRKIIHIGIGPVIPIAQYLKIDQNSALIFTGIITFLILANYSFQLLPFIEDIDRKSFGTFFYCLSLFILIFLFWDKDPSSLIAGVFIMTFGDGLAGLIGKNFDSKSWFIINQKKSLYGTMTMFSISLLVICSISYIQRYEYSNNFLAIAFIATIFEQFSFIGIDNLIVPITTAICFNLLIS